MKSDLLVLSYLRTKVYVDRAPMLFGADKELADALDKIRINGEVRLECLLVAGWMSAAWRAHGKIPELFFEKEGIMLLLLFSLVLPPAFFLLDETLKTR